jgi:hypothetical protein
MDVLFWLAICISSLKLPSKMQEPPLSAECSNFCTGILNDSFVHLWFLTQLSGSYDSEADDGPLVLQVLSLSDRYMLPGLKRQCEAVLRSRLDQVLSLFSTSLVMCNRILLVLRGIHATHCRHMQRCLFAWSLCVLHRRPLQGCRCN